jgi:hypothetical protein
MAINGDEEFYLSRASFFVKNIFKVINGELNFALFVDTIVDRGFFVPGVSIILLPVSFIFAGSPPLYMIRAYAILINILLVFFIYRELVKLGLKQTKAKLAVIIPFLIPYYLYYSGAIWGDLIASHAAILLFLFFERRLRDENKKWCIYICIGAGAGFISLTRPQYCVLPAIFMLRLLFLYLDKETSLKKTSLLAFLLLISFLFSITPWHIALYKKFGPFFYITSPKVKPFAKDDTYMKQATKKFGPNLHSSYWIFAVQDKLYNDAQKKGITLYENIRIESKYLKKNLTKKSFLEKIKLKRATMVRFYFLENTFLKRFISTGKNQPTKIMEKIIYKVNTVNWYLLLILGIVSFLFPFTAKNNNYTLPLYCKGLIFILTSHPAFRGGHARYYVQLIPLFSVSLIIAISMGCGIKVEKPNTSSRLVLIGQVFCMAFIGYNLMIFIV